MDKIMTMEEVVDILVVFDVISKQVGACLLEANSGYSYENILTQEDNEPTQFLQSLLCLINLKVAWWDEEDECGYVVKPLAEVTG